MPLTKTRCCEYQETQQFIVPRCGGKRWDAVLKGHVVGHLDDLVADYAL